MSGNLKADSWNKTKIKNNKIAFSALSFFFFFVIDNQKSVKISLHGEQTSLHEKVECKVILEPSMFIESLDNVAAN